MKSLILFSVFLCIILFIPFVIWRINVSKEYLKFLSMDEKDLDYLDGKKPIFTKYWISNSFYKDYIDKTRIQLSGKNEHFNFAKNGIALKLDIYNDTIILSSIDGIFIKKRAIALSKISKIFTKNQIVGFKGVNFKFVANNFSKNQIKQLKKLKK